MKMKLFIFTMLMIVGMGNVMGQTDRIAFSSDNVNWSYDSLQAPYNYRSPNISAIGGEVIYMRLVHSDGTTIDIDSCEFLYENMNVDTTCYGIDTIWCILPDSISNYIPVRIYGGGSEFSTTVFPKFSNPSLFLSAPFGGGKVQSTLTLSDFEITSNVSFGGLSAEIDSTFLFFVDVNNGDSLVYSGTDTSFVINKNGEYYVKVRNVYITTYGGNSCSFFAEKESNLLNMTNVSVDDIQEKTNFNIYPNPATEYLYFSEEAEYTVFSIAGKEITRGVGKEIDVNDFESGIYILKVVTENGNEYLRFVKE